MAAYNMKINTRKLNDTKSSTWFGSHQSLYFEILWLKFSLFQNFRFEVFMKKKDFTSKQKQNYDITKFVDKCVNIAWFIAIQSYPIILDDSVSRDKTFKYETYQPFDDDDDEDAAVYDYLIWPALLNAESNSLLCQGVAQRKTGT